MSAQDCGSEPIDRLSNAAREYAATINTEPFDVHAAVLALGALKRAAIEYASPYVDSEPPGFQQHNGETK